MTEPNFTPRSVEIEGRALRYLEAGSGEVVVAILDAAGLASSRAHALIAARRRVLVFALPEGEGASSFARKTAAALETLGFAHFDVMGEGAGAAAALLLGLDRPGAVGAIVLVAPDAPVGDLRLAELKCPVLALFGTKDAVVPPEQGGRYRTVIPDCNLMFVYDAGHAIAADRPEALGFIALEFFERRDLFLVNRDSGMTFP